MRTTLDIDDDIYLFAREQAARERVSIGKAISALMRKGLQQPSPQALEPSGFAVRNGIPLIESSPESPRIVTQALIDRIRDEDGI